MENLSSQIKLHFEEKNFCKIFRGDFETISGFIVAYSKEFLIIQESDDFNILGYVIFPISTIEKIRRNNSDKYYHKILQGENLLKKVNLKHKINLNNWETLFKSIKKTDLNVIIENEDIDDKTFDIGPIIKVNKSSVYIHYFDSKGFLCDEETQIKWNQITLVRFDDRYINIFSKYLRKRKK